MSSRREKRDPVQDALAAQRKQIAALSARVSALQMRGGIERRDDESLELRAQVDGLRRALFGVNREPLRPAFRAPVLMAATPGLAARFHGEVPASHVVLPSRGPDTADVRCRCDATVIVQEGLFEECGCGRFFVMLSGAIHVARPGRPRGATADQPDGAAP